jgi:hypothetical protein
MSMKYKVQPGKKITGMHRVYREGQIFPETEAVGDMDAAVKTGIVVVVKEVKAKPKDAAPDDDGGNDSGDGPTAGGGVQKKSEGGGK